MKKVLLIFLAAVLWFTLIFQYNSSPSPVLAKNFYNSNARQGELRYRIYCLGIMPMGEATIEAPKKEDYRGHEVYHLSATSVSLRIFSLIFNGYATIDSYVDAQDFNPMVFKQRLVIKGRADMLKEVDYDQSQGIMTIAGVRRQILPNTQDPLSALFNIRRMDFEKVREFDLNINTNQKNYILRGRAKLKDVSVNRKVFKTVILKGEIKRRDKNPYHKSNIDMVLLKDEGVPIIIKVFASGFLMTAKLIDVK